MYFCPQTKALYHLQLHKLEVSRGTKAPAGDNLKMIKIYRSRSRLYTKKRGTICLVSPFIFFPPSGKLITRTLYGKTTTRSEFYFNKLLTISPMTSLERFAHRKP